MSEKSGRVAYVCPYYCWSRGLRVGCEGECRVSFPDKRAMEDYYAQQLAYQMYQDELSQLLARAQFYTGLQDRDRSWFVTSQLEPYYRDRGFDYDVYRDGVADSQWQQSFDYNKARDDVADSQWQQSFQYKKRRDDIADSQWRERLNFDIDRAAMGL